MERKFFNEDGTPSLELRKESAVRRAWGAIRAIENHERWGITIEMATENFFDRMHELFDLAGDKKELNRILSEYSQGEFTPSQFIAYIDVYTKVGGEG